MTPAPTGRFFGTPPQTSVMHMLAGECLRLRNPTFNVRFLRQITKYLADFLRGGFG